MLHSKTILLWSLILVLFSAPVRSAYGADFISQQDRSAYAGAYFRYSFGEPPRKEWSSSRATFGFTAGLRMVDTFDEFQRISPRRDFTAELLDISFTQHGFSHLQIADKTYHWGKHTGLYAVDDQGHGMRSWFTTAAIFVGAGLFVIVVSADCEVTAERVGC